MTQNTDTLQTMRLNKAIAASGVCSRRKADELIAQGRVQVNGERVEDMGRRVDPASDRIAVDNRPLPGPAQEHVYAALHKPVRVVSTQSDPQGRSTVKSLLPRALQDQRAVPVGRLDFFSEGLLLFSTDGELVHRLTHPRWHVAKKYTVLVRGEVTEAALDSMRQGMHLQEGEKLAPVQVTARAGSQNTTWLDMRLIQGINRQIRRMCRDLDLTILKLVRIQHGPVLLDDLPPGQCRELTSKEVHALRHEVNLV